jgi:hypoxanthine phosphoribosyltransferase
MRFSRKSGNFGKFKKIDLVEKVITIKDKQFEPFINQRDIEDNIKRIATQINTELDGKQPLFVAVLNGAFMFAAELMKEVTIPCEIAFVRLASYAGTQTTHQVSEVLGLSEPIKDRTIVIVEDIVDTGNTMVALINKLQKYEPKEIKIATLVLKPDALKQPIQCDYVALVIPNDFILGYVLDYDGYGRNLNDIYKIK